MKSRFGSAAASNVGTPVTATTLEIIIISPCFLTAQRELWLPLRALPSVGQFPHDEHAASQDHTPLRQEYFDSKSESEQEFF
jgi:hypothetical protein